MVRTLKRAIAVSAVLLFSLPLAATAQRRGGFGNRFMNYGENVPYNGRFTFSRVRFSNSGFGWGYSNAWNHDWPQADTHLPLILDAITAIKPNLNESNIFDLEDDEIFKNPILYMWEPGYWSISDLAARNLNLFMKKGGFIIFDDFEAEQWYNFERVFRRVLPEARFFEVDHSHLLFHSFFDMKTVNIPHPTVNVTPKYYAVYEDNDPSKRMIAFVNFNSDVAEYWEWSGTNFLPVDTTNDAYKLGVNFMMYAFLH